MPKLYNTYAIICNIYGTSYLSQAHIYKTNVCEHGQVLVISILSIPNFVFFDQIFKFKLYGRISFLKIILFLPRIYNGTERAVCLFKDTQYYELDFHNKGVIYVYKGKVYPYFMERNKKKKLLQNIFVSILHIIHPESYT